MKALEDVRIIDLFFERDETAIRYVSEKYGNRLRSLSHSIVKDAPLKMLINISWNQ